MPSISFKTKDLSITVGLGLAQFQYKYYNLIIRDVFTLAVSQMGKPSPGVLQGIGPILTRRYKKRNIMYVFGVGDAADSAIRSMVSLPEFR